jgi:hypothetical protein
MMIQALLEKYWEGETTLEEEGILKAYFNQEEIAPELRYAIPYFQALRIEKALQMQAPPLPLRKANLQSAMWGRVAAAVLVLMLSLSGWRAWQQQQAQQAALAAQEKLYQDTYQNPEEAAREIKAALALVSSKINKGKHKARKGLDQMGRVEKYIPKFDN